ncbi:Hypothetical protein SRAE_2000063200 [Strongyloides ratti]|uniref:Uncharacterized protein n=1 Tax=Strongyloides ratti TaxID=34506 RepID=A0A090LCV5_STRRB|nr:Hypothetical protein SRAE_2000063200 [Strongyloides ratti]CEF65958.1 Hypothetical protein SRAE_2000063200 [Strongyloides ratti]
MVSINYEPLHPERRGVRHGGLSQAKLFFLLCTICAFGLVLYSYYNVSIDLTIMKEVSEEKSRSLQRTISQLEDLHIEVEKYKVEVDKLGKEKEKLTNDIRICKLSIDNERKVLLGDVAKDKDEMKTLINEEKEKNNILTKEIESLKKDIEEKVCNKKSSNDINGNIVPPAPPLPVIKSVKEPLQMGDIEDSLGGLDGKEKLNPGGGEALVPKDNGDINIPEPIGNEAAPGPGVGIPNQENEGFIANDNLPVKDV